MGFTLPKTLSVTLLLGLSVSPAYAGPVKCSELFKNRSAKVHESLFSASEIDFLSRLSTDPKTPKLHRVEGLEGLNRVYGLEIQEGDKSRLLRAGVLKEHMSVNISNLEALAKRSAGLRNLIRTQLDRVAMIERSIEEMGYARAMKQDLPLKGRSYGQSLADAKAVLTFLSEMHDRADLNVIGNQRLLYFAQGLDPVSFPKDFSTDAHIANRDPQVRAKILNTIASDPRYIKESEIQLLTDLQLIQRASTYYYDTLYAQITTLVERRQDQPWLTLEKMRELPPAGPTKGRWAPRQIKNLVINVAWKEGSNRELFASFKGDFDGRMKVEFDPSLPVQAYDFQALATKENIFRRTDVIKRAFPLFEPTPSLPRESRDLLNFFDAPMVISGTIEFRQSSTPSGEKSYAPVLVIKEMPYHARTIHPEFTLDFYQGWLKEVVETAIQMDQTQKPRQRKGQGSAIADAANVNSYLSDSPSIGGSRPVARPAQADYAGTTRDSYVDTGSCCSGGYSQPVVHNPRWKSKNPDARPLGPSRPGDSDFNAGMEGIVVDPPSSSSYYDDYKPYENNDSGNYDSGIR